MAARTGAHMHPRSILGRGAHATQRAYEVDDPECAEDLEHHVGRRHAALHAQVPLLHAKLRAAAAVRRSQVGASLRVRLGHLEHHRVAPLRARRRQRGLPLPRLID